MSFEKQWSRTRFFGRKKFMNAGNVILVIDKKSYSYSSSLVKKGSDEFPWEEFIDLATLDL